MKRRNLRSESRKGQPAPGAGAVKRKKRKRRGARGVLWVIATMLALSGVLRLAGGAGQAIASGLAGAMPNPAVTSKDECLAPPDIAEVLALLKAREVAVADREAAVADRMQALAVAEVQIAKNRVALEEAEASLEATMALASGAAEADLARLTTVYENMKPKDAAPLFGAMAPQFAAGFLGRMRPDAAAAILSKLDPETAYSISVLLAGRNADVPTE